MTTIDFYTQCTDRFEVAAKLVAKAWAQHGSARVLTPAGSIRCPDAHAAKWPTSTP